MKKAASLPGPLLQYGVWLLFCIFLYFYLQLFREALIDDAFITLNYARTLLSSGTWGFFPGVPANSATSPLNVLLLAAISLFTGSTPTAALWLYFICMAVIAWLLPRLAQQVTGAAFFGWLAVLALLFNPLLISTIGLESIVFTMLFVFAMYCFERKAWTALGIILGLLTLARPEGFLFFLIFLFFMPTDKHRVRLTLVYFLCILPWYLFSWIHLGSLLPDTFFIKTKQGNWSSRWDFFNGIPTLYFYVYPVEILLTFCFLLLAALLFTRKIREVTILLIIGLAGLIHFLGYTLLQVPPFHWYYVPEVVSIILFGSLGLGVLYRNNPGGWQRYVWSLVTGLYFLMPVLGMSFLLARQDFVVREMPIHSNWGTREQYEQIGLWLKKNYGTDTLRLEGGEIGTLAYYCECRLLDNFSDRRWLKQDIAGHVSQPGLAAIFWKLNFAFYSAPELPPDDYILRAYFADPNIEIAILKEWHTSTKWIAHGVLLLSRE